MRYAGWYRGPALEVARISCGSRQLGAYVANPPAPSTPAESASDMAGRLEAELAGLNAQA